VSPSRDRQHTVRVHGQQQVTCNDRARSTTHVTLHTLIDRACTWSATPCLFNRHTGHYHTLTQITRMSDSVSIKQLQQVNCMALCPFTAANYFKGATVSQAAF